MPVSPGTRIGAYDVVAPLGEGGMGEVYRARDTRLDRIVALKILPSKIADDPDLQARRTALGVPPSLAGCHLTQMDSYVIEGHVPVDDILKLLSERPAARGLAVPGMPSGSPGMEGGEAEKYDVLIFSADGSSKIYSSH